MHKDDDEEATPEPWPRNPLTFEALDFLYMPSTDVAADLAFYGDKLGGRVVFAIEAFGARVAQVEISRASPRLLLADHLSGEAPILVHRVNDLEATSNELVSASNPHAVEVTA